MRTFSIVGLFGVVTRENQDGKEHKKMTKLISFLSIFFRLLTTAKQTTESD
jgi:hypothetical protein